MQLPSTSWSCNLSQSTASGYVSLSAEQTLTHSRFTRSTLLPSPLSLQYIVFIDAAEKWFWFQSLCFRCSLSAFQERNLKSPESSFIDLKKEMKKMCFCDVLRSIWTIIEVQKNCSWQLCKNVSGKIQHKHQRPTSLYLGTKTLQKLVHSPKHFNQIVDHTRNVLFYFQNIQGFRYRKPGVAELMSSKQACALNKHCVSPPILRRNPAQLLLQSHQSLHEALWQVVSSSTCRSFPERQSLSARIV